MPRLSGTLLLPAANLFAVLLCMVLYRFDPRLAKSSPDTRRHVRSVVLTVLLATSILLGACTFAIVWAAWGDLNVITQTMRFGLPLLLTVVGNCLGKLRPNYSVGIRLPWTMESDVVWTRTHRFSGKLLVALALGLLASVLLGVPAGWFVTLLLSVIIGWSLVTIIYSMMLSRKELHGQQASA